MPATLGGPEDTEPIVRIVPGRPSRDPAQPLLLATTSLHDIINVEAFVRETINRAGLVLTDQQHDELTCEGLAILYQLADRYEPHRPGYAAPGRFSGFAARYLPRKLGDAWHRSEPGHRYVTDPATGKRRWVYTKPPVSLDGLQDQAGRYRNNQAGGAGGELDKALHRARAIPDFVPVTSAAEPPARADR